MNRGSVIVSSRNRERGIDRHHSTVSIVSLILAALAYMIFPVRNKLLFLLIPLLDIADWGLLLFPPVLIKDLRSK